jgi:hypothetical protein
MRELERLRVGALDAVRRDMVARFGQRTVDLGLCRRGAFGPCDPDCDALEACADPRRWDTTRASPPTPQCTDWSPVTGPSMSTNASVTISGA